MNFNDLYEADTMEPGDEFKWYNNPTQEQIKLVADGKNKVHFIAMKKNSIIVFPYDEEFKGFADALKISLDTYNSLIGTAQSTGMGWMVSKIFNIEKLKENKSFNINDWGWVDKYFNLEPYKKHLGPTRIATTKEIRQFGNTARDRFANIYDKQAKTNKIKKTDLKSFLNRYGEQQGQN
jgi:hypothetical protein